MKARATAAIAGLWIGLPGCLLTSSFEGLGPPPPDAGTPPGPRTLASGQHGPRFLALAAGALYWTDDDPTEGAVRRVSISPNGPNGGGAVEDLATGLGSPYGLTLDAAHFYFGTAIDQKIYRCPLGPCSAPEVLVSGLDHPYGLSNDEQRVYWVESSAGGDVRAIDKSSGAGLKLAQGQAYAQEIAVDQSSAYWTNSGGAVIKGDKSMALGSLVTLSDGENGPHGIALDPDTVFFTDFGEGAIKSVSKSSGPATTLATGRDHPEGIAVDAEAIYWIEQGSSGRSNGALMRCARANCQPAPLLDGLAEPFQLVIDDSFVYLSEHGGGRVLRVPKTP